MGEEATADLRCTPTDPSLEFDLFETVRRRVVNALLRRGYEQVEAERAALYLVEVSRPIAHFMKVLTRDSRVEDEEIVNMLAKVIDALPAMVKAQQVLLKVDSKSRAQHQGGKPAA